MATCHGNLNTFMWICSGGAPPVTSLVPRLKSGLILLSREKVTLN